MIQQDELKAGNWISLKYPGSLLAAHRITEIDKYDVFIEDGKTYTLIKVGNKWEYPEAPQKRSLSLSGIKGIPLTPEILESCGFKLSAETLLMQQSDSEAAITKYYSDKHFFILRYKPGSPPRFTYEGYNANIEFVHQLQNIYQDFMNKELEITINRFNFKLLTQA